MKIEVRNGSFGYGERLLFEGINLKAGGNRILTVLGPNGAGKTTLLKCVMGFRDWREGGAYVDGISVREMKRKSFWKRTSYVPQAKRGGFSYRVEDMVVMGLNKMKRYFSRPGKEDYEKAFALLKKFGIERLAGAHCGSLSGGELQMVMMARALISEPELLILDEPESALDMRNQIRVVDAIEMAAKEMNTCCIINTHFPNHALKISDDTLIMGYGRKKLFGATREVVTEDSIRDFFGVDSKLIHVETHHRFYRALVPYRLHRDGGAAVSEEF